MNAPFVAGCLPWWHSEAMPTFAGTIDQLKAGVEATGIDGTWEEKPNQCWRFTARDRAGLNWSATKGTLWFDGPEVPKNQMIAAVDAILGSGAIPKLDENRTIFVVHGHDGDAREQLELVLHRLGLKPYVLQNTDGGGLTIIERLERMIGKNAASSFGIVLLTPDDIGHSKAEGEAAAKPRARQNVILEMGMLLASLTRERVAILQKGFIEHPSDVAGIIYIPFSNHVKEAVPKLVGRFQAVGINLDPAKIAEASA
jgi:predicted nucleotide-binding protein